MKIKYKNRLKTVLSGILLSILPFGCTDWLEVDPIDKVIESRVFGNEANIQQAINGIYLKMGENSLYGRNLSMGTIELLAQQYASEGNSDSNPLRYNMLHYNYTVDATKDNFLAIWKNAYEAVLNVNNFIEKLENTEGVIVPSRKDILLGEAYGLRAYLHLDLLRLFGPVYLTDSTSLAIPYRSDAAIEYRERVAATEVMSKIIADLDKSMLLLQADPVITEGAMAVIDDSLSVSQTEIDPFYRYRNRRMNYYAAGTLKVRALMYRNDKPAAAALAKTLLESSAVPDKFKWAENKDIFSSNKEDRIFSTEVIFGVHSPNMYSNWTTYFSPGITTLLSLYATSTANMEYNFDVSAGEFPLSSDWRSKNWSSYTNANYMVTYKLAKSNSETTFWHFQPLIRKAELYYALAECEEDVAYLDEVRTHRNLKKVEDVNPVYNLDEQIRKEFVREMHNEGQIFYFFKRKYLSMIRSGSLASDISMSKSQYVIPIPQSELDK